MARFLSVIILPLVLSLSVSRSQISPGVDKRVVCYFESWTAYRTGDGNFQVEFIDSSLCTHIIYAFAGLNSQTYEICSLDPNLDMADNGGKNTYARLVQLKLANPKLKVLLAIGGFNEGSYKYSVMATDAAKRRTFINSVISFVGALGFDGLDIDWEYPANRGGASTDKQYFVILLQELRQEFDKRGWLLTIAVGMGPAQIQTGYDTKNVASLVDFINLMTYDFRGSWDGVTGHHTQLYRGPSDNGVTAFYNLNASVYTWIDGGAPPSKMNLGMAIYGKTYTVPNNQGGLGVAASGAGNPGPYTSEAGLISYNEMCVELAKGGWQVETNNYVLAPWAFKGDQWIAFDNVDSVLTKSRWANEIGLGGGMVWSIDNDDFRNLCNGGKYPLLNAINSVFRSGITPTTTPSAKTTPTTTTTKTTTTTTKTTPTTTKTTTTTTKTTPPTTKLTSTTTSTTKSTTTSTPTTTKPTTTSTTTTQNPSESCTLGTYKPDPMDCSRYYQCGQSSTGTIWISRDCPPGLLYNPTAQICDFPANVIC